MGRQDKGDIEIFAAWLDFVFVAFAKLHSHFRRIIDSHDPCVAEGASFFPQVILVRDLLSVCLSPAKGKHRVDLPVITRLITVHVKFIRVAWSAAAWLASLW